MKRNKWNKDIDLMVRIMGQGRHPVFYQEIERIKLNFVSTYGSISDILSYLRTGVKTEEWELVKNRREKADIVRFKMYKETYDIVDIVRKLGSCRLLEFKLRCNRPYCLTPKMTLLATEKELLILTLGEAPLQFADGFVKEIQKFFWINKLRIG